MVAIYTLNDPRTGETRYVGKTDNPERRLKAHIKCRRRTHCASWIKSLKEESLEPVMEVIDRVPATEWRFWEVEYVRVFRMLGIRLTNICDGGEGAPLGNSYCVGRKHSTKTREKIGAGLKGNTNSQKGCKRPEKVLAKMRMAQRKRRFREFQSKRPSVLPESMHSLVWDRFEN